MFESALEFMSSTKVCCLGMASEPGKTPIERWPRVLDGSEPLCILCCVCLFACFRAWLPVCVAARVRVRVRVGMRVHMFSRSHSMHAYSASR